MLVLLASSFAGAQTNSDEEAVRALPRAFSAAWAEHNGHKLAEIMAEDVDFVTVRGVWLQGRANFQKYHTRILSGRLTKMRPTHLWRSESVFPSRRGGCSLELGDRR